MSDRIVTRIIELMTAGQPVDWTAAKARYPNQAAVIRQLQSIDTLVERPTDAGSITRPGGPGVWARRGHALLGTLAALEIAVAFAAYGGDVRTGGGVPPLAYLIALAGFGIPAIWLLLGGRRDRRAITFAVVLLLIAVSFVPSLLRSSAGIAGIVRGVYLESWLPTVLWAFLRQFPRTVHYSRSDRLAAIAERWAAGFGALLFVVNILVAHTGVPDVVRVFVRSDPIGIFGYWTIFFALLAPAPPAVILRSRAAPPDERRRLGVFSFGFAAVLAVTGAEIALELIVPAFRRYMSAHRSAATPLFFGVLLLLPVTTAYAVLVDNVLDVRMTIGRVARYLLARQVALALTVLPFLGLGIYLYIHRSETVATLFAGAAGLTMILAFAAGVLLTAVREPLLQALEAYFDRHTVDLHGQTAALASLIGNARSVSELTDILEHEIASRLGLTHVSAFERTDDGRFRVTAQTSRPLPNGSAIAPLATADRSPVALTADVLRLLPAVDRRWCADSNITALVPMMAAGDRVIGFLALGPKNSAEPIARGELAFASATAAAAAMRWESLQGISVSAAHISGGEPAFECVDCRAVTESRTPCACGGRTRPASVPFMLADKFQAIRYVGAGGMGVVYLATDVTLTRPVALKTLERLSGEAADRLISEARMMAAVGHPNLATIFAVERWRQTPVLVIEFCERGTLAARLGSPLPIDETLRLGVLVAPALEQLHAAGILHRDIKPSNIGFSRDDAPKLLDFGLASLLPAAGHAGRWTDAESGGLRTGTTQTIRVGGYQQVAGTPLYLPPEALAGTPPGPGFDLWALALVLFEAIAGRHPFAGQTVDDVVGRIRRFRTLDLTRFRPDCPPRVASTFQELLCPDPAGRPPTASRFRETLSQLLD